jgi:hypothetical protein
MSHEWTPKGLCKADCASLTADCRGNAATASPATVPRDIQRSTELLRSCCFTGDAFDFTAADFFGWCRQVGFSTMEVIPLAGPASAGVAYK